MSTQGSVSDSLKAIDKLIKSGNLHEAETRLETIIQANPKNIYARAYKERLTELLQAQAHQQAAPEPTPVLPVSEPIRTTPSVTPITSHKFSSAITTAYRTLLNEVWKDGTLTSDERTQLQTMRDLLGITSEEHSRMEQETRISAFLFLVKTQWLKKNKNYTALQNQFNFSETELNVLQPKLKQLLASLESHATILILDDDVNFLLYVSKILKKNNYHCITTQSAEEGLELLQSMTPDLILCDIAFGRLQMNGFEFYEQFRSLQRFQQTPFIFLTGLAQESLIQTGKKLGIDDYLIKPIQPDRLLATIEGKLRRANEMRNTA